jgi:hypothetical protein
VHSDKSIVSPTNPNRDLYPKEDTFLGTGTQEDSLSFDLFYLYSEIFRAGLKAKSIHLESVLIDKDAVEKLVDLYFFGLIKRQ